MPANDDFSQFWSEPSNVPCNGCKRCCQGEQVIIRPQDGDDVNKYKTVETIYNGFSARMLEQKPNGDCVYLGEHGCTIYEDRPIVCRSYDCRVAYLSFTRHMRSLHCDQELHAEGKKRLHTLDARRRRAAIGIRKKREELRLEMIKNGQINH